MIGHVSDPEKSSVVRQKETFMQGETQTLSTGKPEIWKMGKCSSTKRKEKEMDPALDGLFVFAIVPWTASTPVAL